MQPDLGSTVVPFIIIAFGMLIVGAKILQFVGLIALVESIRLASIDRLLSVKAIYVFLEPFKDPYGTGFH